MIDLATIAGTYVGFIALCTGIAFVGGLAKELYDHNGAWEGHMIGSAFSCAFAGFVCAAGAMHYFPDQQLLTSAFSGLVGWAGPAILNTLSAQATRFIKIRAGAPDDDSEQSLELK